MLNQNEIETILTPQYPLFEEIVVKGRNAYLQEYSSIRHIHRKTTGANIIRDHIVYLAREVFSNREKEGIFIKESANGLFIVEFSGLIFGINGSIWTRFKRLNNDLLTSNIPTKQAIKYNTQQVVGSPTQYYLSGIDWGREAKVIHPSNLNIGYVENELGTGVSGIFATYPNGQKSIAWYVNILEKNQASNKNVIPIPVIQTTIATEYPRVRAKGSRKEINQDSEVMINVSKS